MTTRTLTTILAATCMALGSSAASAAAAPATAVAAATQPAGVLTIVFEGIETPTGTIMMSLFDSEAAHDEGGDPVQVAMAPIKGTTATVAFEGLAPGDYAVKAFHDVDGDMQMSTNPFGMPTEPFAFSNNAPAQGGPAKWEAARFAVTPGANRITITIK
jgi:uncharacterized protein (DUF2141 family)